MTTRPVTETTAESTNQPAAQPAAAPGRPTGAPSHRRRTLARTSPLAAAAAAGVAWLPLYAVADLEVRQGGAVQQVGLLAVAVSALVTGLGALAVGSVVRRTARRPRRTFVGTALVVLVLSLLGPAGAATSAGGGLALACLHVVVAGVVVPLVARSLPHAR